MDDHMIQLLDQLHDFLEEFQIEAPPRVSRCMDWLIHCFVSENAWPLDKKTLMRGIKFVKAFLFYYYADWGGVDEAKDFTSLFEYTRRYFRWLYSEIPEVFKSDDPGHLLYAISRCLGTINLLCTNIGKIYDKLLKLSHSAPFVNGIMFDQFADSVQQYVMNVPEKPCGWGRSAHNYGEVEANYKDTVHKLEGFRYVVSSFCKQCTDKKKSRSLLARSAALVFSILHVANANDVVKLNAGEMEVNIFRSSSDMSRMLSLHNPDAVEVYLEVVLANLEAIKASKLSSSDRSAYSFLNLLQLAKSRVHILGGILDLPILDLIDDGPDDKVKALLKRGYAVASREAGSLSSSIPPNCAVLSNMLQKLNLIKGELFVQEVRSHKTKLTSSTENRAANIREALKFLHQFLKMPAVCMGEKDNLLLQLIEAFLREAGSLCDSRGTMEFEVMIMESSIAIYALSKAEAVLEVLADSTLSLNFLAQSRIEMLHKNLTFFRASLLGEPDDATVSTITNQTMQKGHLLFHMNTCLKSEGVPEVHMRDLWLLFHNFPKSDGVVFAQHLLGKLKKLLSEKVGTVTFMKDETEALLRELEFFTSFLKDAKREDSKTKGIGLHVTSLMYQAECIFDMLILGVGDVPLWYHQLVLYASIQEAGFIKARILQHCPDRESFGSPLQDVPRALAHGAARFDDSKQISEEVIVGFDDQAKTIVDQLRYGSNHLQVVTLVGMAGIGKTTLAEKVYSNNSIQYHFGFRVLCSISQVYRKRELLVSILGDSAIDMGKQDDNDLALKVKQMLNGKRYLIVVDDVWSIEHWEDLKLSFPDDMMGSRILMTTRDRGVARKASPGREPYVLQLLSPSQSWDLLQAKLFQGGKCPGPLWRVGSLIAEHCRGLPLAIVVVAGILKRTEVEKDRWEEIAEHLRSLIADDQERQFTGILEFSYNHLPSYLKPCYLYLGSFLEDQEIQVKKLQWLWMGEGFIPRTVSKSLEETSEGYLVELINRSLVMEVNISSWGGTKTCRVHDMLRDLCIKKAKENNFMQLFSMKDLLKPDSPVGKQYRLCVHSPRQNFIQLRPSASHVHSLLFFATDSSEDHNSYDISTIFQDFKLVRVLDLEPITASAFPSGTDLLICLNYLAIKGDIKSVPSCIAKLWNLETLVKGTKGEIALPSTLWSMASLRHVHIRPSASLTMASPELENGIDMENLTTFSSPAFSNSKLAEKLMKRWARLRKLRCIFLEHWDNSRLRNIFPALEFLTELESLNIYNGGRSFPYELNFPMNLRKLTLSRFSLPWNAISLISQLTNLVVLKLLFKAFEGDVWAMAEETFPKLKVLLLENLNLAVWNNFMDCSDHFPELERLVLRNCKKLVEVPSNFGEASTLQIIEVKWCQKSTAKSVEKILEQQLEWGNQDFQVMITPPEWDFRR